MPSIPVYGRPEGARAGRGIAQIDAPRIDDSIGRALGRAGDALQQASNTLGDVEVRRISAARQKEEEDATAWAASNLADQRLRWTEYATRSRESAQPGGAGYTSGLLAEFDKQRDQTLESAPTPRAKALMAMRLEDLRTHMGEQAIVWEAGQRRAHRIGQLTDGIGKSAIVAEQDPSQFEAVYAEQIAAIDGIADLPPEERDALTRTASDRIASAAVVGMIRRDPRGMLKTLSSSKATGNAAVEALDLNDKLRLRNAAESEVRHLDAEARAAQAIARADFEREVTNSAAMAMNLGYAPDAPGPDRFRAMYGEKEGARRYAEFQQIQATGADIAAVATMGYDEQTALLTEKRPTADTPDFANAMRGWEARARAVQQTRQQYAADPAAYVLQRVPVVRRAYDEMAAALADQQATPETRQAASARYMTTMAQEQQRIGAPGSVLKPLPSTYIDSITQQYQQNATKGQGVAELTQSLAQQWGDHWPSVYGQLAQDGKLPASALVIGAGMKPGPAAALAAANLVPRKDLVAGLESTAPRDIRESLAIVAQPLMQSMSPMVGGTQTASTLFREAETLAIQYMRDGEADATTAAERAWNDVAAERYTLTDTYRVPNDQQPEDVERGATFAIEEITPADVLVPPDAAGLADDQAGAAWVSVLKDEGYWVTSPNEDGLVLYARGAAVQRANGQPYRLTWAQVRQRSADNPPWRSFEGFR